MNDINLLMQRIEEINTKGADELTAGDIDDIIENCRQYRARKARGEKVAVKATVDLSSIVKQLTPKPKVNLGKRI